jgi:oxalate decarboxylase
MVGFIIFQAVTVTYAYHSLTPRLYFHQGHASATVFIGNSNARTFDFSAGDTAVFPDNSGKSDLGDVLNEIAADRSHVGHYIENTGSEDLVWIEVYKSDRVKDISLTQWLALTPANIVADVLHIPIAVAQGLKKDKQILIK